MLAGNIQTCLQDPYSVVLSEDEARKQFGSTDVLGKTVLVKNNGEFKPYKVTAVAKRSPQNSSIKFDVLMPLIESAEANQTPAERKLELYHGPWQGDIDRVFREFAY